MSLWHLIFRELLHRKLNFALALLAVTVGVGAPVGAVILLQAFEQRTEEIVAAKEAEVRQQMAAMENEFRKITKRMGFNILILPRDQNLADFYAESFAAKTMPEDYAHTLANARGIVTIRHVLPMLQVKTEWPEIQRKVLLIGVQGEMPWAHRQNKKPILKLVPPGTVAVGYELHRGLGLKQGDVVPFRGKSFRVHRLHPERGTIDDITLWIDLKEAQTLFQKQGEISAMMALECKCAWADLAKVRQEIQAILPETQVIELAGKALARAEARHEVARNAAVLIRRERENRTRQRAEREGLLSVLVPLVIGACALFVGILAFLNVRERRAEIGILRALGLRTAQILAVFLGKAAIIGLFGAVLGLPLGIAFGSRMSDPPILAAAALELASGPWIIMVLVLAPLLSMAASWIPALLAAGEDPAAILREE